MPQGSQAESELKKVMRSSISRKKSSMIYNQAERSFICGYDNRGGRYVGSLYSFLTLVVLDWTPGL